MNSKLDIDSSDRAAPQNNDEGRSSSDMKDDQHSFKSDQVAQKLNHFMVDKRYSLKLDEVI